MTQLPIWAVPIVVLFAFLAGRWYGSKLHTRGIKIGGSMRVSQIPLLPLAMLAFVVVLITHNVVLNTPRIGWYLPVVVEYYIQPFMWALQLLFVLFSLISVWTLAHLTQHRFANLFLMFLVVVGLTVEGLLRFHSAAHLTLRAPIIANGMIFQSTASTCAAASCANLVTRFGMQRSEAEMVELLNTTWQGTSPSQIVYGLRKLGLESEKVTVDPGRIDLVTPPAILLVDNGDQRDGHAVALMTIQNGIAEIWDPSNGIRFFTPDAHESRWLGHAIEVRKP